MQANPAFSKPNRLLAYQKVVGFIHIVLLSVGRYCIKEIKCDDD